ncbi:MAG: hypothetical protein WCE90_07030 [Candidatus Zixiibacteriota bacterium]
MSKHNLCHSWAKTLVYTAVIILILDVAAFDAESQQHTQSHPLVLQISSSDKLSGTAGDYVTVNAQIKNTSQQPITDITTYLSLVDTQNKLPVDLEDWSAEKGLYIGTIEPDQILPLNWKIHFVKAGTYWLIIVAIYAGSEIPQVSSITSLQVNPKRNLNPGQVLPVALGTPIVLILIFSIIIYKRQTRIMP